MRSGHKGEDPSPFPSETFVEWRRRRRRSCPVAPPAQNRCWFAARVVAVRQRYGLTVDQREADALDQVLAGCASTELITSARGEVPATATPASGSIAAHVRDRVWARIATARPRALQAHAVAHRRLLRARFEPPPRRTPTSSPTGAASRYSRPPGSESPGLNGSGCHAVALVTAWRRRCQTSGADGR